MSSRAAGVIFPSPPAVCSPHPQTLARLTCFWRMERVSQNLRVSRARPCPGPKGLVPATFSEALGSALGFVLGLARAPSPDLRFLVPSRLGILKPGSLLDFLGSPSIICRIGRVGNGSPLQYSCLENLMDRGARRATVHEVAKSRTRLSD